MFGRLAIISAAVMIIFAVATCAIELPDGKAGSASSSSALPTGLAVDTGLERCRKVTLDRTQAYDECRRLWAENRRRFFGKTGNATEPSRDASSDATPKDQSRLPQGLQVTAPREGE